MNSKLPPDWLNACLDGELSPDEQAAANARLGTSQEDQREFAALQVLDHSLRKHLVPPDFDEARFLTELERRAGQTQLQTRPSQVTGSSDPDAFHRHPRPASKYFAVTVAVIVLAAIGLVAFVRQGTDPATSPAGRAQIAKIVRFVGQVEMQRPTETSWQLVDSKLRVPIVAGSKVRTLPNSLCEVETAASGVLRLNENTELLIRTAAEIELVAGEFWCMTPEKMNLTVRVPGNVHPGKESPAGSVNSSFVCPPDSPMQWSVSDQDIRCLSLSDKLAVLTSSQTSCSVEPNQWLSFGAAETPHNSGFVNRLSASAWQLPLLSVGRPDDPELQSLLQFLLQSMLANVGRTKITKLDDSQIRSLGPAGTIPLIAFVRSPKALEHPSERRLAMQIIADLAPESARPDLEVLSIDDDPIVSRLAITALTRLNAGRPKA